jgi:hypothetical protein
MLAIKFILDFWLLTYLVCLKYLLFSKTEVSGSICYVSSSDKLALIFLKELLEWFELGAFIFKQNFLTLRRRFN